MASRKKTAPSPAEQPAAEPFFSEEPPPAPAGAPVSSPKPMAGARRRQQAEETASTSSLAGLRPVRVQPGEARLTADALISPEITGDARKALAADIERIRKMRKPFGSMSQKLAYPQIPGYHIHWFSDEPGRVDEAENNGWAKVLDKTGKAVKRVVGRSRDGKALDGYLMKLPEIFWQEDMAARHDAAKARIDEIKRKPFRAKPGQAQRSDAGKFYDPHEDGSGVVQESTSLMRSPAGAM